ncbi:MAG: hypothetical protein ACI9NC_005328, partial [Verrucomicrobiales bacterium]
MKLNARILILAGIASLVGTLHAAGTDKPNILWLVQEDTSPWIGCYGYEANQGKTPV